MTQDTRAEQIKKSTMGVIIASVVACLPLTMVFIDDIWFRIVGFVWGVWFIVGSIITEAEK